jgi:hypothetical protein
MKKCSYCGRLSDDTRTACDGCGTALPEESFEQKSPQLVTAEIRIRRAALLQGVFRAIFSLGILAIGLLYPAWYLGPHAVQEFDNRLEKPQLFSLVVSFTFAVLAVKSFLRARNPESVRPSR